MLYCHAYEMIRVLKKLLAISNVSWSSVCNRGVFPGTLYLRLTALKLRRTLTSGNLGIARDFFSSIQNRVTCFNSQWMLRNIILTAYQIKKKSFCNRFHFMKKGLH